MTLDLQRTPHPPVVALALFHPPTAVERGAPIRGMGQGQVVHAPVHTDDRLGLLDQRLIHFSAEDDVEPEDAFVLDQRGEAGVQSKY